MRDFSKSAGSDFASLQAREEKLLELAKSRSVPQEAGRVYSEIAFMYAGQAGRKFSDAGAVAAKKTIVYCKKALEYPLEVLTAIQLYVYLGDALLIENGSETGRQFDSREQSKAYLNGLRIISENQSQEHKEPLPVVNMYDIGGSQDTSSERIMRERRTEEVNRRVYAETQNQLIDFRKLLVRKCAEIYAKVPDGSRRLEMEAQVASVTRKIQIEIQNEMSSRRGQQPPPSAPEQ